MKNLNANQVIAKILIPVERLAGSRWPLASTQFFSVLVVIRNAIMVTVSFGRLCDLGPVRLGGGRSEEPARHGLAAHYRPV